MRLDLSGYLGSKVRTDSQQTRHQELANRYAESLSDGAFIPRYQQRFKKLAKASLLSETELDRLRDTARSKDKPGAWFLAALDRMLGTKKAAPHKPPSSSSLPAMDARSNQ